MTTITLDQVIADIGAARQHTGYYPPVASLIVTVGDERAFISANQDAETFERGKKDVERLLGILAESELTNVKIKSPAL